MSIVGGPIGWLENKKLKTVGIIYKYPYQHFYRELNIEAGTLSKQELNLV